MKNPLALLVDSNALIHRAYHAYPQTLTTPDGEQINAVYGFFSIIIQVLTKYMPDVVFFAFDSKEKTFRHKLSTEYKATRKKTDKELIEQFKVIKKVLTQINFNIIEKGGYEADDIIGTLARMKKLAGYEKIIITGDNDLLQLINDEVKVFLSGSTFQKSVLYDAKTAEKKLGLAVDQLIEYKALRGDISDNIPGVKGIGEVSAKKLLGKYKNIEDIFNNLVDLEKTIRNKLERGRDSAYLSRELAMIDTKVSINKELKMSGLGGVDYNEWRKEFWRLGFRSLIPRLDKMVKIPINEIATTEASQLGIFGVDNGVITTAVDGGSFVQQNTTLMNDLGCIVFYCGEIDQEICTEVDVLEDDGKFYKLKSNEEEYASLVNKLKNSNEKIVIFDSKLLHRIHLRQNLPLLNIDFDIKLASYLLRGGRAKVSLEELSYEFLGEYDTTLREVDVCARLYVVLKEVFEKQKTEKPNLYDLLHNLEIPLTQVLARMEVSGIRLDIDYLRKFEDKLSALIKLSEDKIYSLAGQEFNIASPKQLGEVLFSKLQLPGGKKNKNGGYSTNEKILNSLVADFPIVRDILDYRGLAKLKSTYTSTLINQVDEKTGRIHSVFHQDIATTGRLTSTNPNLQNIPVSSELGQEVRRAFIPGEGKKFVFFDYSQQELRLLAHLSNEQNLIESFNKDTDIHSLTASRLLKKPIDTVTKEERRMGKTVNFGIIYGISAFGLSDSLKIETSLGQKYIDSFFSTYPKVKDYFDNLLRNAKKEGFVTTILGRRRSTDGLNSPMFQVRKATEREVINFPLQGSAADMVKIAMIKAQAIIDHNYKDFATLILQVHDELIFEVIDQKDDLRLKNFAKEINTMMLEVFNLRIKMKVDTEVGYNLADSEKFII